MQLLPHDMFEEILERLPVRSLLRFKCVSKQWRCTIESRNFQDRQLIRRRKTQDPDVLFVSVVDATVPHLEIADALRTLVVGSSDSVKIPAPWENELYQVCSSSCDGLICLYDLEDSCIVVNPATRWHRMLPISNYQLILDLRRGRGQKLLPAPYPMLGFGKDKFRNIYKPVWLYNSVELGLENVTTCEVFDFSNNAWRKLVPASPYRILFSQNPIHFDGSLHWFTAPYEGETKVLSLDLHTETFQVITKAPFLHQSHKEIIMCNLDDRLCVSEKKWPEQKIWSFNAEMGTWEQIFAINLITTSTWLGIHEYALKPLAVLGKNKVLLNEYESEDRLVIHDRQTGSYGLVFTSRTTSYNVSYFQSLISIL